MTDTFRVGKINGVVVKKIKTFRDSRGWLAELFRIDEWPEEFYPAMSYISYTIPGVTRGPHEHVDQADLFCFLGPSNFKLRVWDNRRDSTTFRNMQTLIVGEQNPAIVLVPKAVVHAYQNIGDVEGLVINCPNRLYMGTGKKEAIDEIRHEDDPETKFVISD